MNTPAGKRGLLKEPLLHFILIGAALFLVFNWKGGPASTPGAAGDKAAITVSRDSIERMNDQFTKTWQRQPSAEEQKAIIEDLVRSEVYYREAIAIGLDRDDEVLKRRMRQKMEFIFEDLSSWAEPSDSELTLFMNKNREKYVLDPQLSFRQVFINSIRRGESAGADARQALEQLKAGTGPDTVGDPTMLAFEADRQPLREIGMQFGEEFAKALVGIKPGTWAGPVRSGYGLHLVFVKERREGRLPDLKDVREAVKRDWLVEKQKDLKDSAYARIRERYTVVVEKPRIAAPVTASAERPERVR